MSRSARPLMAWKLADDGKTRYKPDSWEPAKHVDRSVRQEFIKNHYPCYCPVCLMVLCRPKSSDDNNIRLCGFCDYYQELMGKKPFVRWNENLRERECLGDSKDKEDYDKVKEEYARLREQKYCCSVCRMPLRTVSSDDKNIRLCWFCEDYLKIMGRAPFVRWNEETGKRKWSYPIEKREYTKAKKRHEELAAAREKAHREREDKKMAKQMEIKRRSSIDEEEVEKRKAKKETASKGFSSYKDEGASRKMKKQEGRKRDESDGDESDESETERRRVKKKTGRKRDESDESEESEAERRRVKKKTGRKPSRFNPTESEMETPKQAEMKRKMERKTPYVSSDEEIVAAVEADRKRATEAARKRAGVRVVGRRIIYDDEEDEETGRVPKEEVHAQQPGSHDKRDLKRDEKLNSGTKDLLPVHTKQQGVNKRVGEKRKSDIKETETQVQLKFGTKEGDGDQYKDRKAQIKSGTKDGDRAGFIDAKMPSGPPKRQWTPARRPRLTEDASKVQRGPDKTVVGPEDIPPAVEPVGVMRAPRVIVPPARAVDEDESSLRQAMPIPTMGMNVPSDLRWDEPSPSEDIPAVETGNDSGTAVEVGLGTC
ncbi:hypothetical protein HK104_001415 [Borealophlyctis nickersoniae]|nr:hypothetical protein HK104_001415 [Borealophlyctis nickersoniae]